MNHPSGILLIISGPSAGVGKDTILRMFLKRNLGWINPVSVTTRTKRKHEVDGIDMQFVDKKTFEAWQKDGKFLESIMVDNNNWYGTLVEPVTKALNVGKNVVLRKDVKGALIIKQKIPKSITIFISAEDLKTLENRIRARATEDEASIQRKLKLAKQEMPYQKQFDHVVINPTDHPEKAVEEVENIVLNT